MKPIMLIGVPLWGLSPAHLTRLCYPCIHQQSRELSRLKIFLFWTGEKREKKQRNEREKK